MKTILPILFVLISSHVFAEVRLKALSKVQVLEYELGVGSEVSLEFVEEGKTLKGLFLGRMINHPELGEEVLFLNARTGKVLLVDAESVRSNIPKSSMQVLVSPIDQAGETCAAYAIFHFWEQLSLTSVNVPLKATFSQERSRMKFLEESITSYYMGRSSNFNLVLNKFGERFDHKCKEKSFKNGDKAVDFVFEQGLSGTIVLMEFNIGPDMVESMNGLKDYETNSEMDNRLWIPRKTGEKNAGGHAIVSAASFMFKGNKKVLVLDSDWSEPRVWDADQYLNNKTAISEMIFHTCH